MSCGVGRRRNSYLAWLWCKPAATVLIGSLAWEPPYAAGAAIKKKKKKEKKKKKSYILPAYPKGRGELYLNSLAKKPCPAMWNCIYPFTMFSSARRQELYIFTHISTWGVLAFIMFLPE